MIPCQTCEAPCCRAYHIGISAWDAFRLARGLVVPLADFCVLSWRETPEADYRILLDGSVPPEQRRYHALSLRKVPDPDPNYRLRCPFLVSVGAFGRCGAYEHRPLVCRTYPARVVHGVVTLDAGGRYCPPAGWHIADVDLVRARRRWDVYETQRELDRRLIDAWNAAVIASGAPRSAEDFLGFVEAVMGAMGEGEPRGEVTAPRLDAFEDALAAVAGR